MSWFESLSKEMFQALVRDAVKEELTEIKSDVAIVKSDLALVKLNLVAIQNEMEGVKQRLTKLEERVERLQENQLLFATKVGHLEGTVEGTLRGLMTELKYDLYERLRNELPTLVAGAQTNKPAKKKTLATSRR
ncbi:MAG: hypothetical protein AAB354_12395 [candidate division KSB1 bacterium]